ncbi:mechanosensitive ion channel family protein [Legionella hackeliae]|uniref:Small-conductance mechanosensitive channel n=1 Tax=Legionella hackeliae TaxID=449 RepID=A0A0A8ULW2_LEGHA|nr:mechanosensitive ion channel family protein [Legionella hackeliae]KTD10222.1 mechanosensitive ion channel MscS [Legionella hackeliae]CEK09718.1 putative MscS mechanosensitive ion channel [Legionella hackeliae]STX49627.1 mechanosensitive ion channel MscS [Legionella hackeliae]
MHLFDPGKLLNITYALSIFFIGYLVAKRIAVITERTLGKRFSRHHTLLASRFTFYLVFTIFFVTSLQHLGFKLSVLLGAAGIFTVAVSFASQTAISNLVSGIFLLFEQPFKVGDTVEIKGINGIVDSIDLLSTKLKTPDNKLVRIPNEAMIKSEITNLSYFSTRRIDLIIAVAYDCDIAHVKTKLLTIADNCDKVLKDPLPNVTIDNFANSAVELKFMVWVNTAELAAARNLLQEIIKQQFDLAGIEAPPPQVTVHRV